VTRKACKRKHYALVNPVELAISGATITPESHLDQIRMRELSAIDNFATGKATPADFRDVADMMNLAQTMGESGIGPEVLPFCEALEGFLLSSKATHDETGDLPMPMAGIALMRDLYSYHDLQRTSVDRSEYERAIQRTQNKIRSAHPDLKVLK
jgi:hypothetical protein